MSDVSMRHAIRSDVLFWPSDDMDLPDPDMVIRGALSRAIGPQANEVVLITGQSGRIAIAGLVWDADLQMIELVLLVNRQRLRRNLRPCLRLFNQMITRRTALMKRPAFARINPSKAEHVKFAETLGGCMTSLSEGQWRIALWPAP